MIDIQPYLDKLEALKWSAGSYIEKLVYSYKWHLVIVTDIKIPFPKNQQLIGHDNNIELQEYTWDKHPKGGWSKPDKIFGDVELRYLWKSFRPQKINPLTITK